MTFAITAPYAAVLTILFIILSLLVSGARSKTTIALGDKGDDRLLEASRRQMNFVENVPFTLLLMMLAEAGGASAMVLNIAGIVLVVARLVHPFGITVTKKVHPVRVAGAATTQAVQLAMVVVLVLQHFA